MGTGIMVVTSGDSSIAFMGQSDLVALLAADFGSRAGIVMSSGMKAGSGLSSETSARELNGLLLDRTLRTLG